MCCNPVQQQTPQFFFFLIEVCWLAWLAVDDCVNAVYMDSTTKYKAWLTATVTKIVSYDVDEGMQLGISRVKCCFTRGMFRSAPLGAHWKRNVRFWYHVRCSVYWKLHASMLGFGARFKVVFMHGAWLLLACWFYHAWLLLVSYWQMSCKCPPR